jgi:hypothetical protein
VGELQVGVLEVGITAIGRFDFGKNEFLVFLRVVKMTIWVLEGGRL